MRQDKADRLLVKGAERATAVAMKAAYEAGWAACDGVFKDQLDFQGSTRRDAVKRFVSDVRREVMVELNFEIRAKGLLKKQMKVRIRRALKDFRRTFFFCVPLSFFVGGVAGYAASLVL
jgi:hypothetical protein